MLAGPPLALALALCEVVSRVVMVTSGMVRVTGMVVVDRRV